jgi:cyclase
MKKGMHFGAGPLIFQKAKELRNRMTASEEFFWLRLRAQFPELRFRRQHPISIYIADFYCHQLKLVIEIDGSIHDLPEVKANDNNRQSDLESFGLKIIRFTNQQINEKPEEALETLTSIIKTLTKTREHER